MKYSELDLRNKILDRNLLPYTHQTFDVEKYLNDNEQFINRLSCRLTEALPSHNSTRSKSASKISVPKPSIPIHVNVNHSNITPNYRQRNQFLRNEIKRLRQIQESKQLDSNPSMLQKQMEICEKSQLVQGLTQKNKELKEVIAQNCDMFELYEKMCRKCEGIRKSNDELSKQIKASIMKINELTGRDDNPNLFIMNFK